MENVSEGIPSFLFFAWLEKAEAEACLFNLLVLSYSFLWLTLREQEMDDQRKHQLELISEPQLVGLLQVLQPQQEQGFQAEALD